MLYTLTAPLPLIFLPSASPELGIVKINVVPDTNLIKDSTITMIYRGCCAVISDYIKLAILMIYISLPTTLFQKK